MHTCRCKTHVNVNQKAARNQLINQPTNQPTGPRTAHPNRVFFELTTKYPPAQKKKQQNTE